MLLVAFSSCDVLLFDGAPAESVSDGKDGKDGKDGLSAYDIAVKNGFVGTEQEWLESLKADTEVVEKDTIVNQEITENNITINATEGDITSAASKGLASIVSVYAQFTGEHGDTYSSAGSGVIYMLTASSSAFIITNYHVIYDSECVTENKISDNITLYLYGMEHIDNKIEATFVGGSMAYDLAVLRVDNSEVIRSAFIRGTIKAVKVASSEVVPGQRVIAIGNPSAEGIAVTSGVVSVDSEYIEMMGSDGETPIELRVIRTDTPINQGNSGGGLFNSSGELVGIVNAKIMSADVENIGYAIPAEVFDAIYKNIVYYCYKQECESVIRPMLGISLQVSKVWTELDSTTGLIEKHEQSMVALVEEGSLASGKINVGDIITSIRINGNSSITIERQYQMIEALINARVGDVVTLEVIKADSGNAQSVYIQITEDCLTAFN